MISVQKMIDALAGRRIGDATSQDEAHRELAAQRALLDAARVDLADQSREMELLRDDLAVALGVGERLQSEVASLRAANHGLVRLAERLEPIDARSPAVSQPGEQLRRQADQDRRNATALQERIDDLLRENEQLLKALAG